MTTYDYAKKLIQSGNYEKENMLKKLDIFLLGQRITNEQYLELIKIIGE